jgi:DNA-binding GntR family transcriptional regulator
MVIFPSYRTIMNENVDNEKSQSKEPLLNRRKVFMPSIQLDETSDVPLHRQIYVLIAAAVRIGDIPNGVRLPSSRTMARLLGVSRNTVLAAFDALAADDLLQAERGAGVWVRGGSAVPDVTWSGLKQVIRAAGYPARVVNLEDQDGNPLYLRS